MNDYPVCGIERLGEQTHSAGNDSSPAAATRFRFFSIGITGDLQRFGRGKPDQFAVGQRRGPTCRWRFGTPNRLVFQVHHHVTAGGDTLTSQTTEVSPVGVLGVGGGCQARDGEHDYRTAESSYF
jgi:hypothetical protein